MKQATSSSELPSGPSQRKCACSRLYTLGSDRHPCRQNRLRVQRRALDTPEFPGLSVHSTLGHDFGRVSLTNFRVRPIGGEQEKRDEEAADRAVAQVDQGIPPTLTTSSAPLTTRRRALVKEEESFSEEVAQPEAEAPESTPPAAAEVMSGAANPATEPTPEAEPAPSELAAEAQGGGLIVEDDAGELMSGQMRKNAFLDELRTAVCAAADAELAAVGRSTQGCPYLERWIGYYRTKDSAHIERAIRKYAPEAVGVTSAREYIPLISERVRRGVATWATTGQITGVPEDLPITPPGAGATESTAETPAATGSVQFKGRDGRTNEAHDPQAIRAQLGAGSPLEGAVRTRMESAFGHDFSRVRVHTDGQGAKLSSNLNARAFTIGSDITFGVGEYQPGTLVGDALLAHELAHVVQQGDTVSSDAPMQKGTNEHNSLEEDADVSAVGAVVSMWSGAKGGLANIGQNAMPRLRSGLQLQRCTRGCDGGCEPTRDRPTGPSTAAGTPTATTGLKSVTNADGKGWLIVKYADGSTAPPLPQYLKVDHTSTSGGREYFTIKESGQNGRFIGAVASVTQKPGGGSYLATGMTYKGTATVAFDKTKGELTYGSGGPLAAKTDPGNPVPNGTLDLEIPDELHPLASGYTSTSVFAETWFRIGHSGDRFLHPGRVSAGCTTVTDIGHWNDVYAYLINSRKDDKSVGTLKVT